MLKTFYIQECYQMKKKHKGYFKKETDVIKHNQVKKIKNVLGIPPKAPIRKIMKQFAKM